jgi:hypothetical protein
MDNPKDLSLLINTLENLVKNLESLPYFIW